MDKSGGKPDRKRQRRDSWDEDYDRGKVRLDFCYFTSDKKTEVFR